MESAKPELTFESLFDDDGGVDPKLFKEAVLQKLLSEGKHVAELKYEDQGFQAKVIDPHRANRYNKFKDQNEYESWLRSSLHEPTQDEIEEALNRGTGT